MAKNRQVSLLKAEQVAEILNISKAMAYRLMKYGEIPTVIIGRAKRVKPDDLDSYIYKNTANVG
jgi:excisionase family DNA binding protein